MQFDPRTTNHAQFAQMLRVAPRLTRMALNKSVLAGLAEIAKRQNDHDGGVYQFRTKRAKRTGMLAKMFSLNTATAMRTVKATRLGYYAETFSTVKYADEVVEQYGNNFYQRILREVQPDIDRHNKQAIEGVLKRLGAIT